MASLYGCKEWRLLGYSPLHTQRGGIQSGLKAGEERERYSLQEVDRHRHVFLNISEIRNTDAVRTIEKSAVIDSYHTTTKMGMVSTEKISERKSNKHLACHSVATANTDFLSGNHGRYPTSQK